MTPTLEEYRVGRNYIRPGDIVHVLPSRRGKHDGGEARVVRIMPRARGDVIFHVIQDGANHYYPLDRIRRRSQTRNGERKATR